MLSVGSSFLDFSKCDFFFFQHFFMQLASVYIFNLAKTMVEQSLIFWQRPVIVNVFM